MGLANCERKEEHNAQAEATFERALAVVRTAEGKYGPPANDVLGDYVELLRATHRNATAAEMESLEQTIAKQ